MLVTTTICDLNWEQINTFDRIIIISVILRIIYSYIKNCQSIMYEFVI